MVLKEITNEEWELLQSIRNYRNAYPNGARMLQSEINDLLDILMDIEYQEEQEEEEEKENE